MLQHGLEMFEPEQVEYVRSNLTVTVGGSVTLHCGSPLHTSLSGDIPNQAPRTMSLWPTTTDTGPKCNLQPATSDS
ncbi:hypothetical protein WMY93_029198 [Mugilogobius chulae]|uniref:Uncharacterized protein n=1 Tax=Mugilogobius chulae TaxID=88201 RepID=A0AAW0MZG9_9GOBI